MPRGLIHRLFRIVSRSYPNLAVSHSLSCIVLFGFSNPVNILDDSVASFTISSLQASAASTSSISTFTPLPVDILVE